VDDVKLERRRPAAVGFAMHSRADRDVARYRRHVNGGFDADGGETPPLQSVERDAHLLIVLNLGP
jgi:hypothetical protein